MVRIPTTERQFYNIPSKVNSLEAFSKALMPAAETYRKTIMDQQKVKIDTKTTQGRVEADKFVQDWRLRNQANPDSADAKQELQNGLNEIWERYGQDIDPMARGQWDLTVSKLNGAYEIANNEWAFKQRAENATLDVAENMNANYQLAKIAGRQGNINGALADYANSYQQLYSYAEKTMGATEARKLLKDYEEDYKTSFVYGLAESNPQAAINLLKDKDFAKGFNNKDTYDMAEKIVNKQIAQYNLNKRVMEFNNERNLAMKLDDLEPSEALQVLDENEENISKKYFKAKKKALLSSLGIDADTQAEEAAEIMLDIAGLNKEDTIEYYKQTNDILSKIEDKYGNGYLSTADRKRLVNAVYKGQGKNIDVLKNEGSGWKFWDFSYKDANEYIKDNYSGKDANRLLLDYFREIEGNDYDNAQKKQILTDMVNKTKNVNLEKAMQVDGLPSFNTMDEAKEAFRTGKIKKGDKVVINGVKGTI